MNASHRLVTFRPRDALDRLFEVSVLIKGLDGLVELIGGLALLLITPGQVERLVAAVADSVLGEALPATVATWADVEAGRLTTSGIAFGAIYLLAHGAIKVVLVCALLRNQIWAYPWMIVVLIGFVGFQSYELASSPSIGLALLTAFDVAVLILTWREYRRLRRLRRGLGRPGPPESPSGAEAGRDAQVQLSVETPS